MRTRNLILPPTSNPAYISCTTKEIQ
jgi:hypothetical protein